MSRDKQIEEMAQAILELGDNYDTCCEEDCITIASLIYGKGYRKASDVAEEIFAEIDKLLAVDKNGEANLDVRTLAALQKKYTQGKAEIPRYVRMEAKALPAILNVKYTESEKDNGEV